MSDNPSLVPMHRADLRFCQEIAPPWFVIWGTTPLSPRLATLLDKKAAK